MKKDELLNHVADNEFAFFVKNTEDHRYKKNDVINSFENWKIGKEFPNHAGSCDMRNCKVVSVTKYQLNSFIDTCKNVYHSIECVYVPDGSNERFKDGFTIEKITAACNSIAENEKSKEQILQEKLDLQDAEIAEMKKMLKDLTEEKKVGRPKIN